MVHQERQIQLATKVAVIKKRPFRALFGTLFTFLPLFMITLIASIFSSGDYSLSKREIDEINAKGKLASATITGIETQFNETINNEHPSIIAYAYSSGGSKVESKFKTLAPDKVSRLNIGDRIDIKFLNDKSLIVGMEQSTFPYFLIGIPFLLIGLPFLISLIFSVRKELNLYRYGIPRDAKVISMSLEAGGGRSRMPRGVRIHYQYENSTGQRILGNSTTDDLTIINEKKNGDLIKVFVSRDNESQSCLIPRLEAVRNNWDI